VRGGQPGTSTFQRDSATLPVDPHFVI